MVQKNEEFSQSQLSQMLKSPEAAALLGRLRQMDPAALQRAVNLAFQGQTQQAQDVLTPMLQDEQVQTLTKKLRNGHGGI